MDHPIHQAQAMTIRAMVTRIRDVPVIKLSLNVKWRIKKVKILTAQHHHGAHQTNILSIISFSRFTVEATRKRSPTASSAQIKTTLTDSTTNIPSKSGSSASSANSKKSTRREELLKQLRAVEDAIARKRSKIN